MSDMNGDSSRDPLAPTDDTISPPAPKLSQPPGLWCLFIVEMWERFSYYGMRAILVLYLVAEVGPDISNPGRNWPDASAAILYGYYTGLVYLTPILGGLIADRLIGTHRSMVAGSLLIAMGHVVLAISGFGEMAENHLGMSTYIAGLALIILGTGHFKPCVSVMVGQLYEDHDPRRDGGFTIFYMGINVGAFLAPLVCGWLGEVVGWHYGFGAAAIGMVLGLFTYLFVRPIYLEGIGDPPEGKANTMPLFIVGSIILSAIVGLAWFFNVFSGFGTAMEKLTDIVDPIYLTIGGLLVILFLAAWFIMIQGPGQKGPVFTVLCFIIFNAFFWMAFEQAGSSLTLFADRNTDRVIFGWEMPASWFQVINPFLIVALAPLYSILWVKLGRRNMNPTQSLKIFYGLILLGVGYIFMVFAGIKSSDGFLVGPQWLALAYLLHTMGELCLSPTGLSFVTKASPVRWISFIMGLWFLSSVVANFGGGLVAATVTLIEAGQVRIESNDGGKLTVTDRVGGEVAKFMVTAPEDGSDAAARSLGILMLEGVNDDSFDGVSVAREGYKPPAETIGDFLQRVNIASNGKIVAEITQDGLALQFRDTTSGDTILSLDSLPRSHTPKNLLLTEKERVLPDEQTLISGNLVDEANKRRMRLGVRLAELRDGQGIDILEDAPDLIITTHDGQTIHVDLGSQLNGERTNGPVETIGDVIDRILQAAEEKAYLQAAFMEEGNFKLVDKTKGDGEFSIADAPGAVAATQLEIVGSTMEKNLEGDVILGNVNPELITPETQLAWLNDGDGVSFEHEIADFTITTRDGTTVDVNLGAINAISKDTPLSELNAGEGIIVDDDDDSPDIAFSCRDGKSTYAVNLTGVETVGELADRISANTGKINPFWNKWGIRFAGQGDFFFLFVFSSAVAAVLVLVLTPLFKRLLHGVE